MRKLAALLTLPIAAAALASPPAHAGGTATGTIHFMNPGASLVLSKMQTVCNGTPETQGTDGYVLTIGPATRFTVTGTPAVPGSPVDLDVYFINSECKSIGDSWYGAFVINAPVPAGTKYVLIDLTIGAEVKFNASWT